MDKGMKRKIQRNSAVYGFFAVLLLWLNYFNDLTVGDFRSFLPYLPDHLASMSLSVVLLPLLVSISVFYVASLFGAAFEGTLNELLVGSLYAAGFAVFFALFLIYSPGSEVLNQTGYLFLAAFAALLVYNLIATFSRLRSIHEVKAVAASATIYVEGQIVMQITNLFIGSSGVPLAGELWGVLDELLHFGFLVAAAISLLAVFKTSRNAYLSFVGDIASNYVFIVPASIAGSLYFKYFQGRLEFMSPGIANLSPYIEWTGICILAAFIYMRARKGIQASMMAEARVGDWIKHVQEVGAYKGGRFLDFAEMISGFIEGGRRGRLLVGLTTFLHENRVGDEEISGLLSDLINYEDAKKPAFSVGGRSSTLERENEAKRRSILRKTINKILPLGLGGSAGLRGPEQGDEGAHTSGTALEAPGLESSENLLDMEGGRDGG